MHAEDQYHHATQLTSEISDLQLRLSRTPAGVLTLATAESATAGGIAARLTDIAGASDYFLGGLIAYSNLAKRRLLKVRPATLDHFGAVSAEVAEQMAEGGRSALGADVCVADTGIAGPGGATTDKPVGLFYVAIATPDGCQVRALQFGGDRAFNRAGVVVASLLQVRDYLLQCCVARGANDDECL